TEPWQKSLKSPAFAAAVADFLVDRRWFAGKARTVTAVSVRDDIPLAKDPAESRFVLLLLDVAYAAGPAETYLLPVSCVSASDNCPQGICRLNRTAGATAEILVDAAADPVLWTELLGLIAEARALTSEGSIFRGTTTGHIPNLHTTTAPRVQSRQQSHSSAIFGQAMLMKLFRRVAAGFNPEVEIGEFLTHVTPAAPVPALLGWLDYRLADGTEFTAGVLQAFVPNDGDAWGYTLQSLGRFCERVRDVSPHSAMSSTVSHLVEAARLPVTAEAAQSLDDYGPSAEVLGRRTGELHVALASRTEAPGFAPARYAAGEQRALYESMLDLAQRSFDLLKSQQPSLPAGLQQSAASVLSARQTILARFDPLLHRTMSSQQIRVHGDYHLGQVLFTGSDFVIIDFEGEPDRPVAERRVLRTPLRDVAGMLRSFHYACHADVMGLIPGVPAGAGEGVEQRRQWLDAWHFWTASAFLRGYLAATAGQPWLPDDDEFRWLLEVSLLEKLVYELSYELNSRPDWTGIPLAALLELVA
ncbi:MAG: hypothetical protein B7Z55_06705, partial [Planctomycetales bacterium 12-60-4]